jgi:hypothetical protein
MNATSVFSFTVGGEPTSQPANNIDRRIHMQISRRTELSARLTSNENLQALRCAIQTAQKQYVDTHQATAIRVGVDDDDLASIVLRLLRMRDASTETEMAAALQQTFTVTQQIQAYNENIVNTYVAQWWRRATAPRERPTVATAPQQPALVMTRRPTSVVAFEPPKCPQAPPSYDNSAYRNRFFPSR